MKHKDKTNYIGTYAEYSMSSPCIGTLCGSNSQRDVLVSVDESGSIPARLVAGLSRTELIKQEYQGKKVLVIFEHGDPGLPIIIALMEDPLESLLSFEVQKEQKDEQKELIIDGKRITLEGKDEVVLKCGRGSITIKKDGRIIVKGTNLLSRSSGPHRIKGASVNIN